LPRRATLVKTLADRCRNGDADVMEDRTETEHPAADDARGAEKEPGKVSRILRTLGPGIVTGAADDDP